MGALIALAARLGALSARGLATRGARLLPAVGAGIGGVAAGEALFGGDGDGLAGGMPRRRRRRKALTNDDMRTALTIASAISKKASENFILMRVRGQ